MINIKRISIKPLKGLKFANKKELAEKEKQIIELLGIKASELNCIFDEEPEKPTESEIWNYFSPPQYSH
jgi:hypothetical protein